MKFRVSLLCLVAVLAVSGEPARKTAKPLSPAMTAWPIGKLNVEGNKIYQDEKILAVAGLKLGQMAGKAEFDAARDRLLATGAFESVGYKFEPIPGTRTNSGTFQITEITQLFPYKFEELRADEKALRAYLRQQEPLFGDEIPATQQILDRMTKDVRTFVKSDGIVAKLEGTGNLNIVFRPSSLPSVAEITFKGNTAIPTTKLQQIISGAGIGSVFTEDRFRQILDANVKPAYEALGYMRVQFPTLDVATAKSVSGVAVTVHVKEGAVYKLGEVELAGELADSKELLKVGGFATGETVNFDKIRAGVENIRKALRRKGYIEAKTSSQRRLNDERKTLDVIVTVEPGPQFTMGKLTIQGLDVETEPHIKKLWALKRGQPFDAEYPDYFLGRLVEDQIMDNLGRTKSAIAPDPENKTVDVTLTLEGEKRKPAKKETEFP
jgi:outer membrane protein insertion porin family